MRAILAGFIAATLYTLAVGALMGTAMPSRKQLQAIDASYQASMAMGVIQIVEVEANPSTTVQ